MSDLSLFYYTNQRLLVQIQQTGVIPQSTDERFGVGVLLTSLSPDLGKLEIAMNVFGGNLFQLKQSGGLINCSFAIQITIPINQVVRVGENGNLWLYPENLLIKRPFPFYPVDIYLYHYTSEDCTKQITKSRRLLRSNAQNRFGPGVYFTGLPPSVGRKAIAINNWGNENPGKTAVAIEIPHRFIPNVKEVKTNGNRDIWVHLDEINLQNKKWRTRRVSAD